MLKWVKKVIWWAWCCVGFVSAIYLAVPAITDMEWMFVRSRSVYFRIALVEPFDGELQQGDYVTVQWRGEDPQGQGLQDGMMLTKRVICLPGQRLSEDTQFVGCEDEPQGVVQLTNSKGETVAPFLFDGEVPQDKVYLMGDHPRSYDSRYLGFFDIEQIQQKVVWVIS